MSIDTATTTDAMHVGAATSPLALPVTWHVMWNVQKYDEEATRWLADRLGGAPAGADFDAARIQPYAVSSVERNLLTTAGLTRITSLIVGAAGQALTNTSGRIGVGNGVGTAAVADTDLSAAAGATNRWFNIFDASYPTVSAGAITCRSTFGVNDGNFAWNEFGIDIGTPTVTSGSVVGAVLLNHKTSIAQGTKASGQSWVTTATITIS